MPVSDKKLVTRIQRAQELRHVTANGLSLALIVLDRLKDGKLVPRRLLERAIKDLQAVMAWVEKQQKSNKPD